MIKRPGLLLFFLLLPLLLSACGKSDFQGRYVSPDGAISYEFLPDGKLIILDGDQVHTAHYDYHCEDQTITLTAERGLPSSTLRLNEAGHLETGDMTLIHSVDYSMLDNSTWIGDDGQYTFALTFTQTEKGMETFSELVSYYDDDMSYAYQTDDSITRLTGNQLLLDRTPYTVSNVSEDSLTLSIGNNSMQLKKYPKGTPIQFRDGYRSEDELPDS